MSTPKQLEEVNKNETPKKNTGVEEEECEYKPMQKKVETEEKTAPKSPEKKTEEKKQKKREKSKEKPKDAEKQQLEVVIEDSPMKEVFE